MTILSRQGYRVAECESCEDFQQLTGEPRLDLVIYAGPEEPQVGCGCPVVRVLDDADRKTARDVVVRPIRQEALLEAIYGVLTQAEQGTGP